MARPRSWWRKLFTDHPGLAEQLSTGSGYPKVWCTLCLQAAEAQYACEDQSLSNRSIWDDKVFCEKRELIFWESCTDC